MGEKRTPHSPFLTGCGSLFERLEPRAGRSPRSGGERTRCRWRKWHKISASCCRLDVLSHRNTGSNFTEVEVNFPPKKIEKKKHEEEGDATGKRPTADTASLQQQQQRFKLLSPRQWREGGKKYERFPENTISDK